MDGDDIFAGMELGSGSNPTPSASNNTLDGLDNTANSGSSPVASNPTSFLPPVGDDHLQKFREQSRQALESRDAEADEQHKQIRQKAQETLANLSQERKQKIESRKKDNLEREQQTKAKNESLFKEGPVWDRVVSLVDLNDMSDKQARKTARMREILRVLQSQQ